LRAHLDDLAEETRSQGYDDEAAVRIVRMRFGEPEVVVAAFASVYAPERLAKRILQSAILVTVCSVAVVVVIGTVQSIAAICTARSIISTLRDIHRELVGSARLWRAIAVSTPGSAFFRPPWRGAFAKRHVRSMARRGFRLADPAACGTALGCVCVCRNRPPAAAHGNTPRLVCWNSAAAAHRVGVVWSTDFRLAVPVVGVVRLNNFLQGAARNCSGV